MQLSDIRLNIGLFIMQLSDVLVNNILVMHWSVYYAIVKRLTQHYIVYAIVKSLIQLLIVFLQFLHV